MYYIFIVSAQSSPNYRDSLRQSKHEIVKQIYESSLYYRDSLRYFTSYKYPPSCLSSSNYRDSLGYSIVDMFLNIELGKVVLKREALCGSTNDVFASIKHSNNVDYWVVSHDLYVNNYVSFFATSKGINHKPVISTLGNYSIVTIFCNWVNMASFSIDDKNSAVYFCWSAFDLSVVTTLKIYNDLTIDKLSIKISIPGDTCFFVFSFLPHGTKLYKENGYELAGIYQYNLSSNNIASTFVSKTLIIRKITLENIEEGNQDYQIGPDGNLYLLSSSAGIGKGGYVLKLPYFRIIYNLSASDIDYNCYTNWVYIDHQKAKQGLVNISLSHYENILSSNNSIISYDNNKIKFFPNLANNFITLTFTDNINVNAKIVIFNVLEKKIRDCVYNLKKEIVLRLENFQSYYYDLKVQSKNKIMCKKILKKYKKY